MAILRPSLRPRNARGKTLVLLGLILSVAGCRFPPFDKDLALALTTANKMDERARVTIELGDGGPFETDLVFIPDKGKFDSGFLVARGPDRVVIRYRESNGAIHGPIDVSKGFSSPGTLEWRLETVGTLGNKSLAVLGFDSGGGAYDLITFDGTLLMRRGGDSPPYLLEQVVSDQQTGLANTSSFQLYPDPAGYDRIVAHFMFADGVGDYEVVGSISPSDSAGAANYTASLGAAPSSILGLPANPEKSAWHYYRDPPPRTFSFLSRLVGTGWKTYRWTTGSAMMVEPLGITRRVDAVFTSGELYCGGSEHAAVYDGDGSKKYEFPLGDLEFLYEFYEGPSLVPTLMFGLPLLVGGDHESGGTVEFRIYTLATKDLGSLD